MRLPSSRALALFASFAAMASLVAYAARSDAGLTPAERASADLLPHASLYRPANARPARAVNGLAATAPTTEEVGDVDSFGRSLVWLGVAQGDVELSPTCPVAGGDPAARCVALNAAPAQTAFSLDDIAHVTLPARSANSLLCYWFSPLLTLSYDNPTANPGVALLSYSPTLTVESEVLNDPAMIDPMTGMPFNGRLTTGMTSSERFETPLAAGQHLNERSRDSAVCIAGFLSKRALVDNYGLTAAQADLVFKKPMTIRLNVSGNARLVGDGSLIFGLRIIGD